MKVLQIVDAFNSNSNVGEIRIELSSYYKWNDKIITKMMN